MNHPTSKFATENDTIFSTFLDGNGKEFTFWKGRIALYILLKAIGIGPGDEVIIPGFTCVVVPNAVLYLGAQPIYADIDYQTYNISFETIAPLITSRTRVIIVQNTFGLSPDLDPINALAKKYDLVLIEDCAHGLGSTYNGRPAGTNTDAAFFSTQWSKPITTGIGGVAYISNEKLTEKVSKFVKELPSPSIITQMMLIAQCIMRPIAISPAFHYNSIFIYRLLTQKFGLFIGSSVGRELETIKMPPNYMMGMGILQKWHLKRELKHLNEIVQRRQLVAKYYDNYFLSNSIEVPYRSDYADHSMLRYSIRVANKHAFLKKASRLHIPMGDWFVSPLHPVKGDLSLWGYQAGQCPEAEKACAEVVNLLTDRPLSKKQLDTIFG